MDVNEPIARILAERGPIGLFLAVGVVVVALFGLIYAMVYAAALIAEACNIPKLRFPTWAATLVLWMISLVIIGFQISSRAPPL